MKQFFDILKPAIILCVICGFLTAALATTNMFTKDIIDKKAEITTQEALHSCIEADSFEEVDLDDESNSVIAYKAIKDNKLTGYAFSVKTTGYGGDISTIVGIKGGKVTTIEITDVSNETPGLGQNAKNSAFTDKFKGISSAEEVVPMTGATITSNAVKTAVDKAFDAYYKLKSRGDAE